MLSPLRSGTFLVAMPVTASAASSRQPLLGTRTSSFETRINTEVHKIKRSAAALLCVGAICGMFGFILPVGVARNRIFGQLKLCEPSENFTDSQPCPNSKHHYCQETVSELVSNTNSPAGKMFQSFAIIGAVCLIVSRYPWELGNVYVPKFYVFPESKRFLISRLTIIRSICPPLGIMMVSLIPVTPRWSRTNLADMISADVHTFGAVTFIGTYLVCEAIAIWKNENIGTNTTTWPRIKGLETTLRRWLVVLGSICAFTFLTCGVLFSKVNIDTDSPVIQRYGLDITSDEFKPGPFTLGPVNVGAWFGKEDGICCRDIYANSSVVFSKWFHMPNVTSADDQVIQSLTDWTGYLTNQQYVKDAKVLVESADDWGYVLKKTELWAEALCGVFVILSHMVIWWYASEGTLMVGNDDDIYSRIAALEQRISMTPPQELELPVARRAEVGEETRSPGTDSTGGRDVE